MAQRNCLLRVKARGALALAVAFLAPKYAAAAPFFEDVTNTLLPAQPCADTKVGCYTSWVTSSDIDGDGDLDIILANGGNYYTPNGSTTTGLEPSTVYLNDSHGTFTDGTASMFAGAKSRLRQVGIGDVDGDGDLDMYQPGGFGIDLDKLWIQTAPGVFANKASELLPAGLMSNTPGFHLGDLDGDGDLDLVTTDWNNAGDRTPVFLTLYLNDGTGKFSVAEVEKDPEFWSKTDRLPPRIPFSASSGSVYWGTRAIDLDFADIDGDFDLDMLVNMRNGISRIFLNDGTAHFKDGNGKVYQVSDPDGGTPLTISNYPMKRGPYVYNQEVCDFDNDGDLDLLLDNSGLRPVGGSSNYTQVLVNDGTGKFKDESRARIFGEVGSDDNAVKCVDLNNDGNYDLLVASLTGAREKLLISDGAGKFNAELDGFPAVRDNTLGIDAADYDGDGIFDVVTGQGEGSGTYVDRLYRGIAPAAKDTKPPKFRKVQTPEIYANEPIVMLMGVTDAVTSETGEMVKDVSVTYLAGQKSGKIKAKFVGGDLFRVQLPPQAAYTTIVITPQATDRVGNKGVATPVSVFVVPRPVVVPSGGAGGGSGAGGRAGAGGGAGAGGTLPIGEAGAGGAPEPPTEQGGMSGMEPEPELSGGMPGVDPGEEPKPTAGTGSGGTTTAPAEGGQTAMSEGGEGGDGGEGTTAPPKPGSAGGGDDDGCSIASTASSSSTRGQVFAVFGLLLASALRRRKRD